MTKKHSIEILEQKGYHFLWIDGYLWMWDIPEEVKDQKEIARMAFGDVLVAGYGLGVVQKQLLKNRRVKSVFSVEKFGEVIEECQRIFGIIYGDVKICNFYRFKTDRKFDCVIGDIWPDQARRHLALYLKFKERGQTFLKEDGIILGWGMDFLEHIATT
jgi:hypothetical protein